MTPVANGNLSEVGKKVKLGSRSSSVIRSRVSAMPDQWRASLFMVMLQNTL